MSFEDLQKKWADQYPAPAGAADERAAAELLERIHGTERRLRYLTVLAIAQNVCIILLAAGLFLLYAVYGFPLPRPIAHKYMPWVRWIGLGFIIVSVVQGRWTGRFWRQSTPAADEPRSLLSGRIDRDYRRFGTLVLWRDLREVAAGMFVVFVFSLRAAHTLHYPGLAWVAVGCFALSTVGLLVYRLQTWVRTPIVDDSLLGTLQLSIYQTGRQVRFLDNIWWYFGPFFAGFVISTVRIWIVQGSVTRQTLVPAVIVFGGSWAIWKLNRWTARRRLRPRLDQLKQLRAELSA